ncbi:Cobalamin biosynthesis protein CobD/CbiB [Pyrobaculum oguniense TE7]|uniref:Probable cobalamin biosynthesis protein CobD n=1 Tax=Pyrobaculum oguniense (strain DSM 13380 / JCM 10595 / TE7) TaxID=698757 RepID=H6QAA8_PYROT|nr:Cobalamin biosynthesis protein CobD/CbiB [Pyrobaculum oguniense TE7]
MEPWLKAVAEAYLWLATCALVLAMPSHSPLLSPDPTALLFALVLEAADFPAKWDNYLVSRLIPPRVHPVALIYALGAFVMRRSRGVLGGVVVLAAVTLPMTTAAIAFRLVRGDEIYWSLAEGYLLKLSFSITHVTYGCALGYIKGEACWAVSQFVRRDLSACRRELVNSACIEAAAESLVDSYVSTLFWYGVLGLPGAWLQRSVNTADGLAGFRHHGPLGAPSAYADTALNWAPARATAALLLATSLKAPGALLYMSALPSPNARWPISAAAAAVGAGVEKEGAYRIPGPRPHEVDVINALGVAHAAAALWALLMAVSLPLKFI